MVNIESLDFLKGPMAALYGRGEAGGLLNINTKKPEWESSSEVNLRANSLEKYRASFEHTAPISDAVRSHMKITKVFVIMCRVSVGFSHLNSHGKFQIQPN